MIKKENKNKNIIITANDNNKNNKHNDVDNVGCHMGRRASLAAVGIPPRDGGSKEIGRW